MADQLLEIDYDLIKGDSTRLPIADPGYAVLHAGTETISYRIGVHSG